MKQVNGGWSIWQIVGFGVPLFTGLIGIYVWMSGFGQRLDQLTDDLIGIAEAERIRDDEWEHDDEVRVAGQDQILSTLMAAHDHMTSTLEGQSVMLVSLDQQASESFSQRENRFEELELEHKMLIEAIRAVQIDSSYKLGLIYGRMERIIALFDAGYPIP